MKRVIFILLGILLFYGCRYKSGSGNLVKQTRQVSDFTGLKVSGDVEVILTQGNTVSVVVEADDNLIEDVLTDVSGSTLSIGFEKYVNLRNGTCNVYITVPELNKIQVSASAEIKATGVFKTADAFFISASSSGEVKINANAPSINLQSSSAGQIKISGRTRTLTAQASSGAEIHARDLLSENTDAEASSGADVDVYASMLLNANASSGGSIDYRGNPTVSKQESSGGSIEKID